jgi:hypothetical protein
MGWVTDTVSVTATEARSVVEFVDATPSAGPAGATLDAVPLSLVRVASATVNGFAATTSNKPYSVAERQMLAKVPGYAIAPASGTPVCALQAVAAQQVQNGTGLLIVWSIASGSCQTSGFRSRPGNASPGPSLVPATKHAD